MTARISNDEVNPEIAITISTSYLEEQSEPLKGNYAFSYTIRIANNHSSAVRLLSRHWIITDQNNRIQEVEGKGVIGQQPLIKPGQSFQYSSGTIIGSEIGDMHGSYTMEESDGETFEVPIPLFILSTPNMIH